MEIVFEIFFLFFSKIKVSFIKTLFKKLILLLEPYILLKRFKLLIQKNFKKWF